MPVIQKPSGINASLLDNITVNQPQSVAPVVTPVTLNPSRPAPARGCGDFGDPDIDNPDCPNIEVAAKRRPSMN